MPTTVFKRTIPHSTHGETRIKPRGYKANGRGVGTYNRQGKSVAKAPEPVRVIEQPLPDLDWDAIFAIKPPANYSAF